MEIRPGIHQIPGLRISNAYLLEDADSLSLIDAGLPWNRGRILRYIESIGRNPRELCRILLTHSHPDHTGPLPDLCRISGASVSVHPDDTRGRAGNERRWLHYSGQIPLPSWNVPLFRRIYYDDTLQDGESLPVRGGLRVVHTPGHTPGSVCFHLETEGVLFTGDMLLSNGSDLRRPMFFPGTNFQDYRASVERLSRISFETACVGHGRPLMTGGTGRLQQMLDHYDWLTPRWRSIKAWVGWRKE